MNAHLVSNTDLILHNERIFNLVYLTQKEGWRLEGAVIIIQTNFFLVQREQEGMISLNKRITDIT